MIRRGGGVSSYKIEVKQLKMMFLYLDSTFIMNMKLHDDVTHLKGYTAAVR